MTNLFAEISASAERLNERGQAYLDRLPFLDNDTVIDRILAAMPTPLEWVNEQIEDGGMPYAVMPRNGSLHFVIGFSVVSRDAHLRNVMEIAEGRETDELDFPTIEPLDEIVARCEA
jgi:hypothetical protein